MANTPNVERAHFFGPEVHSSGVSFFHLGMKRMRKYENVLSQYLRKFLSFPILILRFRDRRNSSISLNPSRSICAALSSAWNAFVPFETKDAIEMQYFVKKMHSAGAGTHSPIAKNDLVERKVAQCVWSVVSFLAFIDQRRRGKVLNAIIYNFPRPEERDCTGANKSMRECRRRWLALPPALD